MPTITEKREFIIAEVSDADEEIAGYGWYISEASGQVVRLYLIGGGKTSEGLAEAVVRRVFHHNLLDGQYIIYKDGDYRNCKRDNLLVVDICTNKIVEPPNEV